MEVEDLADTAGPAAPMSAQDWMAAACQGPSLRSYVASALELALALATHLHRSPTVASAATLTDHLTVDNLIIFVARPTLTEATAGPSITGVQFRRPAGPMPPSSTANTDDSAAICAALGKLLLHVFSKGRSKSLQPGNGNVANASPCAAASGDSESETTKQLLLSLGMPVSICQLVSDLSDSGNARSTSALTSLGDAVWDLTLMKSCPQAYLFDRSAPQALADSCLFGDAETHLFGREGVMGALMNAKNNVASHVHAESNAEDSAADEGRMLVGEAAFLGGYAGSGKSSLLRAVAHACRREQWFVLSCKFDQQSPSTNLFSAFNDFFEIAGMTDSPGMTPAICAVCKYIVASMDDEGLHQLCELAPKFRQVFPHLHVYRQQSDGINAMEKIGAAKKRLQKLLDVLLKAVCSVGHPVLLALDDLQWSQHSPLDDIADFAANYVHETSQSGRPGIFVVGTFRSNEVDESGDLMRSINTMKEAGRLHVTTMTVEALSKSDVTHLVSSRLCLPRRHTQQLAGLVHRKTRGNPYFVVQFLKQIIRNNMLSFSVESRRWTWDCDVIGRYYVWRVGFILIRG